MSAIARMLAARPRVCPHPAKAVYRCEYLFVRQTVWLCRECRDQSAFRVSA